MLSEAIQHTDRKRLGKYYTPSIVADILTDWAIKGSDRIFDPTFGGCAFLYSAMKMLHRKGIAEPGKLIYGVDCDSSLRKHLIPLLNSGSKKTNFIIRDFLMLNPRDMPGFPFDAICLNPPFVRFNLISKRKLKAAYAAISDFDIDLPRNASYWAYFLLHSLKFLRRGGRIVSILPITFLYTNYAKRLRRYVIDKFEKVGIALLNGHIFEGSLERPVILLASGFRSPNRYLNLKVLSSLKELREFCSIVESAVAHNIQNKQNKAPLSIWRISSEARRLLEALMADSHITSLGQLANIRIGIVTGANDFFIVDEETRQSLGISANLFKPIISRSNQIKGMVFTNRDYRLLRSLNERILLLDLSQKYRVDGNLRQYIQLGEDKGYSKHLKCRQRSPWYVIEKSPPPHAFIHYMSSVLPHIVINRSNATSTNAIHHLIWKQEMERCLEESIAVASVSTLTQLTTELFGRTYGGGVLKLEPSDCRSLLLAVPPSSRKMSSYFREVDLCLKEGNRSLATNLADEVILEDYLGMSKSSIMILREARLKLVKQRLMPNSKIV